MSSRQDRIRGAYRRAVGDHDYSRRDIKDYYSVKDLLPAISAAVPDVTLEEVCAARWEDQRLRHCPMEIEVEHAPYCLQVPTGDPTDADLIGPFDNYEQAQAFAEAHPDRCKAAQVRCMNTPAFEFLCEQHYKAEQRKRVRLVTKLGLTTNFLKHSDATPEDVIVQVSASVARDVAKFLERNCPLPHAAEICALLKTIAKTHTIAVRQREER